MYARLCEASEKEPLLSSLAQYYREISSNYLFTYLFTQENADFEPIFVLGTILASKSSGSDVWYK